ncbi:MAG: hypothetical protein II554_03460, partial [Bacteroidales bacterium]|nr:hypothetical protein [Bacteroidales bacterium]
APAYDTYILYTIYDFEDLAYAELKVEDLRLAPAIYTYDILSQKQHHNYVILSLLIFTKQT